MAIDVDIDGDTVLASGSILLDGSADEARGVDESEDEGEIIGVSDGFILVSWLPQRVRMILWQQPWL